MIKKSKLLIVFWAVLAALLAVWCEFSMRRTMHFDWRWMPLAEVVIGFSVYKMVTGAPTFLAGVIVFSASTLAFRILASTVLLQEALTWQQGVRLLAMISSVVISFVWR